MSLSVSSISIKVLTTAYGVDAQTFSASDVWRNLQNGKASKNEVTKYIIFSDCKAQVF